MLSQLAPLGAILRLNTRLLLNCLDGMTQQQANARPNALSNNAAFLACHLTESRHFIVGMLPGDALENPLARAVSAARGIDDIAEMPSLDVIRAAWLGVSQALASRFEAVDEHVLIAPSPQRFPITDGSTLGAIAFLVQHDSYHIGQLALLRKYVGMAAMSYAERTPVIGIG